MDNKQKTLVEDLVEYAALAPKETPYIFFSKQADKALTTETLDKTARSIASHVLQHTTPKARVILLYPAGLEFITTLFGCFYAEVIAVPMYTHHFDSVKLMPWLKAIMDDTEASAVLTLKEIVTLKASWEKDAPWLNNALWIATDEIAVSESICWEPPRICSDAIALLQYSSGSTGMPKGVMVTHKNLMSNVAIIREAFGLHPGQKVVSWLPHYHDMGLIGNILCSVFSRTELHFCSPMDFVRTPLVWLQRITNTKASVSGGPNFAYDLCSRYIKARDYTTLDLSHWKIAYNGAEAVRDETLKQFERIFSPYGFKQDAFTPCYGLAESTLMVASTPKQDIAQTQIINREAFRQHQIQKTETEDATSQVLVSSGVVQPTVRVEIVNPKTRLVCREGEVGEIWVLSPSVCAGYWNRPQLSDETFKATLSHDDKNSFLRTGDLGVLSDGYLYVTGRIKDLIIIRGQNHAPEDIESTVISAHPLLKNTRAVALSITNQAEEQLVILVTEPKGAQDVQHDIVQAIHQHVSAKHNVRVHDVQFARRSRIPVTSSGKIRRGECKQKWIEGQFSNVTKPLVLNSAPVINNMSERCELILAQLQKHLAQELRLPLTEIDANISLQSIVLDSLSKIRIQHDIQRLTGVQFDVARFEQNISLLQFSQTLSDEMSQTALQDNLPELKTTYNHTYPLSSGQKALFFMQELMDENTAYYLSRAIKITSPLNIPILQIAFNQLLEHHVALRTRFFIQDGVPMQSIVEGITPAFKVIDACSLSDEALASSLKQAANAPFELDKGLMAGMVLFKRTDGYVLLLSVHHMVSDLLSLTTLVKALLTYYVKEPNQSTVTLTKPSAFPETYVAYETEFLQSSQAAVMRQYWLNELDGSIEPLHLPLDKTRPRIKTYQGKSLTHRMPKALSERVIAFANAHQVTPYVVLMSAYIALLHRYTHQTNILVGSPMANRSDARFAELIAYLVNPVVIRAQCFQHTTFLALMDEVHLKIQKANAYQAYPFAELVEALKVERDTSRTPIFQVMMSYLNPNPQYDLSAFALNQTGRAFHTEALTFEPQVIEHSGAQFDLNVGMAIVDGCVASTWEYSTDLFFEDTIQQMSAHFQVVLDTMVSSPETTVGAFPLVHQVTNAHTEVKYDLTQPLHALFEAQAQKTPHHIAILDAERTFTYEALNQQSNQLAHKLCRQGIGPHTLVALQLERSIEMVVAIYAVLKTGATYLPIAPDAPAVYVSNILDEASPQLVLKDIKLAALSNEPTTNLNVVITPDMPAYVIYTSGSTGKPKGVVVPHRGIRNRILWMQDAFHLETSDRVLQKTPYTFDVSLWEFFWPLGFGASLYMSEPEGHKDTDYLIDVITKHAITIMHFVPSMLSMFLMHEKAHQCKGLKQVFCSGEALRPTLAKDFLNRLPAALHNLYGPTEASVDVSYWTCTREEAFDAVPIGHAIANTELYILDTFMQAVPRGVSGELYIGGSSLANGYLNRQALTKERFVYDTKGNRLYKTGDLCRYLPDGTIAYLGRLDSQVKVRGFRIELEAVETAVASYSDIEQAIACVIEADDYQTRLGVYCVLKDGCVLSQSDLKAYLHERLLEYMVPTIYMPLDNVPLLPSGKVNKKALPNPKSYLEENSLSKKTTYLAPETKTEQLLCSVYEVVLKVKPVGILDNFFDLGGDSILALQAVAMLRDKGLIVTVQALYSNATIQSVGANIALNTEAPKSASKTLKPFEQVSAADKPKLPEGLQNAYPLSNMQEGLVFHSEFSPDYEIYVMGLHVALCLDEACVEKALSLLSLRHALLRTSFDHLSYSEPLQLVHPSVKIPTRIVDIQALSNAQQDEAVEQYMREEKWRKFDWSEAPFLRLIIHKRSATSNQFTFCHPLFDGWSMGLLITEFFTLYGALLKGNVPPLDTPEKLAYQDFIILEREAMQAKATKAYWSQTLAGIERCTLPRWPEYRNNTVGMHERMTVSVENDVLLGLQALARKADVPLKSVLLAAHMRVVSLLTGQQDVTTGLLVNGRPEQTGGDKIAGMFLNTAP
ncbi:MAG: amino acid adenylation domain-containing protein, partial [Gammaproteobacteria bacterium]|nr:amino acid adenylation domain-containing protein [Gammaproteobacteria bacterium]